MTVPGHGRDSQKESTMHQYKIVIACLIVLAPAVALAQQPSGPKGAPKPITEKAQKEAALHSRMGQCHTKAKADKLQPGSDAFRKAIAACLHGG